MQHLPYTAFLLIANLVALTGDNSLHAERPLLFVESSSSTVRSTVTRSLPYLEERGVWWIEEKQCVSCHRVSFQTWSLGEALRHGFDVDVDKLDRWIDWSFEKSLMKPEDGSDVDGAKNVDGWLKCWNCKTKTVAGVG